MNIISDVLILLTTGTKEQHAKNPFLVKKGNFTLVSDAPELRFHDGKTPGGVVIPLEKKVHDQIKDLYANERSKWGKKDT
jgi:hypothetical protein